MRIKIHTLDESVDHLLAGLLVDALVEGVLLLEAQAYVYFMTVQDPVFLPRIIVGLRISAT